MMLAYMYLRLVPLSDLCFLFGCLVVCFLFGWGLRLVPLPDLGCLPAPGGSRRQESLLLVRTEVYFFEFSDCSRTRWNNVDDPWSATRPQLIVPAKQQVKQVT